jgi:hypothetical protein
VSKDDVTKFLLNNKKRMEYATWVDYKRGYFYVETPKVACSTVKTTLQQISGFELPKDIMTIHYRQPEERFVGNAFTAGELDVEIVNNSLFKFCFIRDPVDRLLSAFKDKIVRSKGAFWDKYRDDIVVARSLESTLNINFEDFVYYVKSLNDSVRDIHWRSQYALLRPDMIQYDFIGHQENFNVDFAYVLGRIGCKDFRKFIGNKVNSTVVERKSDIDAGLKMVIRKIYEDDYKHFNLS